MNEDNTEAKQNTEATSDRVQRLVNLSNKPTTYDRKTSCNKCGGKTSIKTVDHESGIIYECETNCEVCGFNDYWAYGFFQSGMDGFNDCEKYTVG